MKAIRIHEYGSVDVLRYEETPEPVAERGDVVVRVRAAGVNPVDWKIRSGGIRMHELPLTPGWDVSGVVVSGGQAAGFIAGDEVFARPDIKRQGAYAETMVVRESELALKPKSLAHVHAAAVPLAALTAWQALFDAPAQFTSMKVQPGQTVLVHAGAGGVGSFAVQLAKNHGCRVVATASSRNAEFVRSLGADDVVDYTRVAFEDLLAGSCDAVFDTVGGEVQERSWKALKPGGVLGSITSQPKDRDGKRAAYVFVQPNADQLTSIAKLIDDGKVRVEVSRIFPLRDARRAHEESATGHVRGKIVLEVP